MLLIKDADRIEIRIADLLADLKVVVAVVDERLRVLAEVERSQPLDHDVTRHGHGWIVVARVARARLPTARSPPFATPLPDDPDFATVTAFIIRCARRRLLPSRVAALQATA